MSLPMVVNCVGTWEIVLTAPVTTLGTPLTTLTTLEGAFLTAEVAKLTLLSRASGTELIVSTARSVAAPTVLGRILEPLTPASDTVSTAEGALCGSLLKISNSSY